MNHRKRMSEERFLNTKQEENSRKREGGVRNVPIC